MKKQSKTIRFLITLEPSERLTPEEEEKLRIELTTVINLHERLASFLEGEKEIVESIHLVSYNPI